MEGNRYKAPRGPKPEDMAWIAMRIAQNLKSRLESGMLRKVTTEDVIEAFRNLNDDYDDYWARGLNTREKEQQFMQDLFRRLAVKGIKEIEGIEEY